MTSVWYIGRYLQREISSEEWGISAIYPDDNPKLHEQGFRSFSGSRGYRNNAYHLAGHLWGLR